MGRPRALQVAPPMRVDGPIAHHDAEVTAVAIGPDGRLLATADASGVLHLCDLELGRLTFTVSLGGPVRAMAATSGVLGAGVGDRLVVVHGFAGRVASEVGMPAPVVDVAATPDGAWLVALGQDGALVAVRTATGREKARGSVPGATRVVAVDDRTLALQAPLGRVGRTLPRLEPASVHADLSAPVQPVGGRWVVPHPSGVAAIVVEAGDVWVRAGEA